MAKAQNAIYTENMVTLYSSISSTLKRKVLFRGSLLSGTGLALLLITGAYSSISLLERWGIAFFGISMGLIAFGLIPYRKLCFLETHPHQIIMEPNMWTIYIKGKTKKVSPKTIRSIRYLEKSYFYGIRIEFYKNKNSLFLPFFTRSTYETYLRHYLK